MRLRCIEKEKICNIKKGKKTGRKRRSACYGMVGDRRIKEEMKLYKKTGWC
jgi:hypothetical protein